MYIDVGIAVEYWLLKNKFKSDYNNIITIYFIFI